MYSSFSRKYGVNSKFRWKIITDEKRYINSSELMWNICLKFLEQFILDYIISRESDSTITNVCSSVRSSVRLQNPSTAWNHHPSSFNLHPSSYFIHPSSYFIHPSSSFIHPSSSFIILHHPSFISRLLSFSACFLNDSLIIPISHLICFLDF